MTDLAQLEAQIITDIAAAADESALEAVRVAALGKKGSISALLATLGKMSPDERKTQGAAIRPGDNEARDRLVSVTKSGFAFVGAMIKTGAKREYADSLLEQAEAVVDKQEASTSPEQRALVRRQCEEVGAALLKRASSVERAFISYKAKKEVERYLAKAAQRR